MSKTEVNATREEEMAKALCFTHASVMDDYKEQVWAALHDEDYDEDHEERFTFATYVTDHGRNYWRELARTALSFIDPANGG